MTFFIPKDSENTGGFRCSGLTGKKQKTSIRYAARGENDIIMEKTGKIQRSFSENTAQYIPVGYSVIPENQSHQKS